MAHGLELAGGAGERPVVAVIGDSTFAHSGLTGLMNAVYNGSHTTTVVLDNRITAMTGHQDNPFTGRTLHGRAGARAGHRGACAAASACEHVDGRRPDEPASAPRARCARRSRTTGRAWSWRAAPCALLVKSDKHAAGGGRRDAAPRAASASSSAARRCRRQPSGKAVIDAALCVGCAPVRRRRAATARSASGGRVCEAGEAVVTTTSVLLVGVGGQGTILAGDVLAKVAAASGLDVKLSEVHGMSQRGGSVDTMVRFGEKVYSPVVSPGEVDHLVAFEVIEAARWVPYLRPGGPPARQPPHDPAAAGAHRRAARARSASRRRCSPRTPSSSTPSRSRARRARRARRTSCCWARCRRGCRSTRRRGGRSSPRACPPKTVEANLAAFELGREAGTEGGEAMKVEQLAVFIENKPGRVSEIAELVGRRRRQHPRLLRLRHGRLRHHAPRRRQARRGARRAQGGRASPCARTRSSASSCRTSPARSAGVLHAVSDAGVNIEYVYSLVGTAVVLNVSDADRALQPARGRAREADVPGGHRSYSSTA